MKIFGSPVYEQIMSSQSGWTLVQDYTGNGFLNQWDFFSRSDPTHGTVLYDTEANTVCTPLCSGRDAC